MVGSERWPGVRFILIHRTSKACVRQTTSRSHPECTSTCSCSFEHHNCRQRRRARRHSGAAPAWRRRWQQPSTLRNFSCSDSKRPLGGDETTLARPRHRWRTTHWWRPQRLPKQRARNRCHTWKDRALPHVSKQILQETRHDRSRTTMLPNTRKLYVFANNQKPIDHVRRVSESCIYTLGCSGCASSCEHS